MSNEQQGQQREREEELGALWVKSGANGNFMTGSIAVDGVKVDVIVFENRYKRTDNHPDYRILKARIQRDKSDGRTPSQNGRHSTRDDGFEQRRHEGHHSNDTQRAAASRPHDDDIPF